MLMSSSGSVDGILKFFSMGDLIKLVGNNMRPLIELFMQGFQFMKDPISKVLPLLNTVASVVDMLYEKGLKTVKRFLNLDQQLLDLAYSVFSFLTFSKSSTELKPWAQLPWCSESTCLRQETRTDESVAFKVLYTLRCEC